jgi:Zn-dependent M28 family amino/carboxypeptidase
MDLPEPMRRGARAFVIAVCVLALGLAACGQSTPSLPMAGSVSPSASVAPIGTGTPLPQVDLPGEISADAIRQHLDALQQAADDNDGLRTVGTPGYDASVEYAIRQFQSFGYHVTTPTFRMPTFQELPGSSVEVLGGGASFAAPDDFHAMIFSASGTLTAPVATVGYPNSAGGEGNRGCSQEDWAAFPRGAIALTPSGPCYRRDETLLAQEAGAVALVVAYPEWKVGQARRPTLIQPGQIQVPVLSAIGAVGDALAAAAEAGDEVRIHVQTVIQEATVRNVIAESQETADRVVMVGAHLDSVHDGPGINDNGSGSAAVLEIARLLAGSEQAATLRFALWAGEELGLYGSGAYVQGLSGTERQAIAAYLNLDMLGSPNGVPFVYRDSASASGSNTIASYLAAWLEANGEGAEFEDLGGSSDHYFFAQAGIRTGGIFSGATEIKTSAQASAYGGQRGEPMDACYHLNCDTADNVDIDHVVLYATDVAGAVLLIARGDLLPD